MCFSHWVRNMSLAYATPLAYDSSTLCFSHSSALYTKKSMQVSCSVDVFGIYLSTTCNRRLLWTIAIITSSVHSVKITIWFLKLKKLEIVTFNIEELKCIFLFCFISEAGTDSVAKVGVACYPGLSLSAGTDGCVRP